MDRIVKITKNVSTIILSNNYLCIKKITDKRKVYLIVGSINLVLIGYLVVILLVFLKSFGHDDPKGYIFIVTNQIINGYSSSKDDNSLIYKNISNQGEEIIRSSSSGESAFIGTYDPNTYIYGTDDTSLYISFKLTDVKLNKVVFNTAEMAEAIILLQSKENT